MNTEIERWFDLVAQYPPEMREAILERECQDPAVKTRVTALLRSVDETEAYLEAIVRSIARSLLKELGP